MDRRELRLKKLDGTWTLTVGESVVASFHDREKAMTELLQVATDMAVRGEMFSVQIDLLSEAE